MQIWFCLQKIDFLTNSWNNKHRKKDSKFSQFYKVLFKYLLDYSQKQNALSYRIEKIVQLKNTRLNFNGINQDCYCGPQSIIYITFVTDLHNETKALCVFLVL